MSEFFNKIWNSIVNWFIDERGWLAILAAVAVVVLGYFLIRLLLAIASRALRKSKLHGLACDFLLTILKAILFFLYVMAVMRTLGIDTSGMVAILAASSLALTLALQTTLSNFASGMILVSNRPFEEGDFVEAGGVSGIVEKITLFSTKLKTPDHKLITLPNSVVAGGNIVNFSTEPKRRVDLEFGVAYGTDVDKAKRVMTEVLDEHPLVLHDDGYTVRLTRQAESALVFVCRCWVNNPDYWTVYFDLNENMTKRFQTEGIEIPYNKLDVNLLSRKDA